MSTPRSHAPHLSSTLAATATVSLVAFWVVTLITEISSNGLLIVLATATGVAWVAATVIWAVHRLEAALPHAVELGRQLERLHQCHSDQTVLRLTRRRPVGRRPDGR